MHGHGGEQRRRRPTDDDRGPLRDLVVLDLTIARAGPTAVRYLADWGARVLRIERRSRSDSGQFLAEHESERLPQPAPLEGAHRARPRGRRPTAVSCFRLVEHADVIVENNRAPVKTKLGIDYETLAAINPRLVYGSISGYGQDGPASAKGAVDQIIQGAGGLMSITGPPGRARRASASPCPTRPPATSWRSAS